jgi:hypothetical protein
MAIGSKSPHLTYPYMLLMERVKALDVKMDDLLNYHYGKNQRSKFRRLERI